MDLIGVGTPSPSCPVCGRRGQSVPAATVQSLTRAEVGERLRLDGGNAGAAWWLCPDAECDVVYFRPPAASESEPLTIRQDEVRVPVWWKEEGDEVPLCYCAGLTRGEVRQAVAQGCRALEEVRAATGKTRQGFCLTENPAGRCCHATLREFIRSLAQTQPST